MIASVEDNGGDVNSVLLVCDDEVRRERIVADERKQIGKLTDPDSTDLPREISNAKSRKTASKPGR